MGSAPTAEEVGTGNLDRESALTVSCCLRQPRIASGGTLFFISLTKSAAVPADWKTTGANALRLMKDVVRDFHLRG